MLGLSRRIGLGVGAVEANTKERRDARMGYEFVPVNQVIRKLRELGLDADQGTVREIYYREMEQED